jgi:hypothetical protein
MATDFFAGGGRFGASADIGANRSERKKTQDDKCCASHISTGRALCGRSLRHPPRSPMRTKLLLPKAIRMSAMTADILMFNTKVFPQKSAK